MTGPDRGQILLSFLFKRDPFPPTRLDAEPLQLHMAFVPRLRDNPVTNACCSRTPAVGKFRPATALWPFLLSGVSHRRRLPLCSAAPRAILGKCG